jgi:hypothetical protein
VVLPIYAAFLATAFQVVGDCCYLGAASLSLALSIAMPLFFAKGLMSANLTSADINSTLK